MILESRKCPNCGSNDINEELHCLSCGSRLVYSSKGILILAGVTKICPNCNFSNSEETKYCGKCGTKLVVNCPICTSEHPLGLKFCPVKGINIEGYGKYLSINQKLKQQFNILWAELSEAESIKNHTTAEEDQLLKTVWNIPENIKYYEKYSILGNEIDFLHKSIRMSWGWGWSVFFIINAFVALFILGVFDDETKTGCMNMLLYFSGFILLYKFSESIYNSIVAKFEIRKLNEQMNKAKERLNNIQSSREEIFKKHLKEKYPVIEAYVKEYSTCRKELLEITKKYGFSDKITENSKANIEAQFKMQIIGLNDLSQYLI